MNFEVYEAPSTGKKRVELLPGEHGGVFVVDLDNLVGDLHGNRAVRKIVVAGLSDESIEGLANDGNLETVLNRDASTGSYSLSEGYSHLGLIAVLDLDNERKEHPRRKSIGSFREFGLL